MKQSTSGLTGNKSFGKERQQVIERYEKIRYAEKNDENKIKSFQNDISVLKQMLKGKKESNNE